MPVLIGLAGVGVMAALWLTFAVAPVEATMGIVQKIFYFHVPSAFSMYLGFATCGVGSFMYLVKRKSRWDAVAVSGAEVGLLFGTLVLTTGPLWARGAWGVYWVWDPQLTLVLLMFLTYLAYTFLRQFAVDSAGGRVFAAVLGLLGTLVIPFIRTAVERWRGQHPAVLRKGGQGLIPEMKPAFYVATVSVLLLCTVLIVLRYRLERSRQTVDRLYLDVAEASP